MRTVLAALGILCGCTSAHAQVIDSLRVPAGAFRVLEIPLDANRSFAMLRAVQVLHALPERVPTPHITEFERLVEALDRLDRGLLRTDGGAVTLTMAAGADRDALRDILDALGLRLRDRRGGRTVEPLDGLSATNLRALLRRGGIDAADVQRRLNDGETVTIAPPSVEVPLPLRFDDWRALLGGTVQPHRLFSTIVHSRELSLLYYGLMSMNADTRAYLTTSPPLLAALREHASAVAAFGGAFRISRENRVLVPGGPDADELWEDLIGEKLATPDRFARALFERDGGRLSYFVDSLWALDMAHAKFALGLWMSDRRMRQQRLRALYDVFVGSEASWSIVDAPFLRPSYDPALLLSVVRVTDDGLLAAPAYRRLWEHASDGIELPDAADRRMRDPVADGIADAAFLAGPMTGKVSRERRLLIQRIAFAQRTFSDAAAAELPDVLVALRGYGRFPAAMMALERIGVRRPAIFAAAARRAAVLETLEPSAAVPLLTQFQGSLAVLERVARTGVVDGRALEQVTSALIDIAIADGHYRGGLAEWLRTSLIPALPATGAETIEARVLDALVDRVSTAGARFSWEGDDYVLDTARIGRDLHVLRARQSGNSLDILLAIHTDARAVSTATLTVDDVKRHAAALAANAAKLVPARPWPDAPDAVPQVRKIADRVIKDLSGIRKPQDVAKAARIVRPLVDAVDYLLGETLVALAYAASSGDTGRGLSSSADISHRHSFGLRMKGDAVRLTPWRRPVRGQAAAGGDAVTGAVMGIDLALAETRLRRLSSDGVPETPRMNDNDRATMTGTVALLNSRDLADGEVSGIAGAIQRGADRVRAAMNEPDALDAVAGEARVTPLRRALIEWTVRHQPSAVTELLSLGELFRLGGGRSSRVQPWGTLHESLTGCYCIQFPDDSAWELTTGRQHTGQTGARLVELNLRVALLLAELRVPATLFPHVMAFATQDYVDSVPLVHPDDWMAFVSRAAAFSRERIEDYVSAVIASGPVRLVEPAAR